jgi:hypothetical protein
MTIADEITREVIFTDYNCREDARIEVVVTLHAGKPVSMVRHPEYQTAKPLALDDMREPDLLRSYAACFAAAAEEMERMARP